MLAASRCYNLAYNTTGPSLIGFICLVSVRRTTKFFFVLYSIYIIIVAFIIFHFLPAILNNLYVFKFLCIKSPFLNCRWFWFKLRTCPVNQNIIGGGVRILRRLCGTLLMNIEDKTLVTVGKVEFLDIYLYVIILFSWCVDCVEIILCLSRY